MSKRLGLNQGYRLAAMSLAMGGVVTLALLAGSGWVNKAAAGAYNWYAALLFGIAGASMAATIVSALSATISDSKTGLASKVSGITVSLLLGVHGSHAIAPLPIYFIYSLDFFSQVAYAVAVIFIIMDGINIKGKWKSYPPFISGGIIIFLGLIGIMGQSWISMDQFLPYVALARSTLIVMAPFFVLLICTFWKPLRLNHKSLKDSFLLRLPPRSFHNTWFVTLLFIVTGAIINLGLHILMLNQSSEILEIMPFLMLSWTGVIWLAANDILNYFGVERHKRATAKLATVSASRFLKRHLKEDVAWAATVGLKTTSFVVDHDPKGEMELEIPASLQQIRAEEIQRCVSEILGNTYLHCDIVGHRIHGCVDPETSLRPCIDALKMFACLYLDAGPLVERRIKGLTSLLPIVDPGLGSILDAEKLNNLIRRNLWFFHFDYCWTDQHIIHTPKASRYDVRSHALQSQVRHAMMDYLEKKGAVGNFVWISPGARDRLLQEAPVLKNVIEPCPITVGKNDDEVLMFIIKFEELIPRLQRFYDFDSMRKSILDFEPSSENHRLLNLLGLQISKARNKKHIKEALSAITSVPWRGFKEKDMALQLILNCYNNIKSEMLIKGTTESIKNEVIDLNILLLDAVTEIGYPSQILHSAQLDKLALRNVDNLIQSADSPDNIRFHEAWLLLSSNEYKRFPEENKLKILNFLKSVGNNGAIKRDALAQMKSIDALAGIGRTLDEHQTKILGDVCSNLGLWFVSAEAGLDIVSLLLDTHQFLEEHLRCKITLSEKMISKLDEYLKELKDDLGTDHPSVIATLSRWQELISQSSA
jgi:hypothetical protein